MEKPFTKPLQNRRLNRNHLTALEVFNESYHQWRDFRWFMDWPVSPVRPALSRRRGATWWKTSATVDETLAQRTEWGCPGYPPTKQRTYHLPSYPENRKQTRTLQPLPFPEGSTEEDKRRLVCQWWNEARFHLAMAVKTLPNWTGC